MIDAIPFKTSTNKKCQRQQTEDRIFQGDRDTFVFKTISKGGEYNSQYISNFF
jgi:hypothetical protein